ncbi:MAG TPA: DNA methyltransferase [Polyangia bacterium]|nr:DNA methyltransferase [Polyangia bacterium]
MGKRRFRPASGAPPSPAEAVRLIVGDALAEMRKLDTASVDAGITDEPWQVLAQQSWDTPASVEVWREFLRVLKPGATLISIGAPRTYHRMACRIEDAGFVIVDMTSWIFTTGRPPSTAHLKPAFAPIVVARKPGRPSPINLDEARIPFVDERDRQQTRRADTLRALGRRRAGILDKSIDGNASERAPFEPKAGRYPSNVFASDPIDPRVDRFFVVPRVRDASAHPCAKPVLLMAHLVRAFTRPGALLLDPFAGGGSTGVGAIATGRRAILIERDPAYAEMARENLDAARQGDYGLPRSGRHEPFEGEQERVAIAEITSDNEQLDADNTARLTLRAQHPEPEPLRTQHAPPSTIPQPASSSSGALKSADEMAALLGSIAPLTLVRWARSGRVPAVRAGRSWAFEVDAVMAALSNHHAGGENAGEVLNVDQRDQAEQIHGPGLQSGPAQGDQAPPLPPSRRSRSRRSAGAGVRNPSGRVGCAPRADPAGEIKGPLGRTALDPDQAARLSQLLGVPVHPVGAGSSGSENF